MVPSLKALVLRDTPFASLMNKRIYNVLLIATKYDAFMLEDDGRVDERIFNEYTELNLRYPPRFTQVCGKEEALAEMAERNFELVIIMPNLSDPDVFAAAAEIKHAHPLTSIVVLTPFSREVSRRMEGADLSHIDYVFSWLGNSELLLAIIKLMEDKLNAPDDMASAGVQALLLVEDSVRFYSSALPHIYRLVLEQSREFAKEALNDHLCMLRSRGRPKVMLARTFEEAQEIIDAYPRNILGVVSDMSFSRGGCKDPLAGYALGAHLRSVDPRIPLLLESSDAANEVYARRLRAPFVVKHTKSYPQDLRREIMRHFGFGDFVIEDPDTGKELLRIHSLKDLQDNISRIPDDALRHHLSRCHFSRFFFSRAIFPLAEVLRAHDVTEYKDMDEARRFISELIAQYRRMSNAGVVAVYRRDRFDSFGTFARIGNGSLGGKGRGLAFMGKLARSLPAPDGEDGAFSVGIPKTVVICTDVFDRFMDENALYPVALSDAPDAEILAAFERARLPEELIGDLAGLLDTCAGPVAVRSSGVLEDSHYQPFAGVYATYMVPRTPDADAMLAMLRSAVKAVYASVFFRESKSYMTATQNVIDQEKMAVVLQEVVGAEHDGSFYPTASGVARSLNFYPAPGERAEDGVVCLAAGLGKHIVDGGVALRFSPARPRHVMQLGDARTALSQTQKTFLALDTRCIPERFEPDDAFNLRRLPLSALAAHGGAARYVLSKYVYADGRLSPGLSDEPGTYVATFDNLLSAPQFPLARTVSRILETGAREMGRPVEVEFALQVEGARARFCLLQIRPIVDLGEDCGRDFSPRPGERVLVSSEDVLGNGLVSDISDVVVVDGVENLSAESAGVAETLRALNARLLAEGRGYLLIGPGRWGSSDPCLGVPVRWGDISGVRAIVETRLPGHAIEPSQGSHFFQNLTSLGVGYFTMRGAAAEETLDLSVLTAFPAERLSSFVRLVRLPRPLSLRMDGPRHRGIVALEDDTPPYVACAGSVSP